MGRLSSPAPHDLLPGAARRRHQDFSKRLLVSRSKEGSRAPRRQGACSRRRCWRPARRRASSRPRAFRRTNRTAARRVPARIRRDQRLLDIATYKEPQSDSRTLQGSPLHDASCGRLNGMAASSLQTRQGVLCALDGWRPGSPGQDAPALRFSEADFPSPPVLGVLGCRFAGDASGRPLRRRRSRLRARHVTPRIARGMPTLRVPGQADVRAPVARLAEGSRRVVTSAVSPALMSGELRGGAGGRGRRQAEAPGHVAWAGARRSRL